MPRVRRTERLLPPAVALTTALGPLFATVVVPAPFAGIALVLAAGVLAQLAATLVVARLPRAPHLGFAAVLAVAAALATVSSPWRTLLAEQAVPWVPLALAWATVRVVEGARTPRQLRVSGLLAAGYLAVIGATAGGGAGTATTAVLGAAVPLLGGLCASLAVRLRQARRDRVAALERERDAMAYRARMDERQRVAAQVHDTLGHVLTLLVLHANALAATGDAAGRAAGERISVLGNQGLTELRRILALLDAPAAVPPRGPDPVRPEQAVRELVEQARAAGQSVDLDVPGPLPALASATASALSRTVQEGLTNARRHAPGSDVRVWVAVAGGTVRVDVRNGPGRAPGAATGTGRGLTAMRHRIDVLGGRCEHARTDEGGYALRVELPANPGDGA